MRVQTSQAGRSITIMAECTAERCPSPATHESHETHTETTPLRASAPAFMPNVATLASATLAAAGFDSSSSSSTASTTSHEVMRFTCRLCGRPISKLLTTEELDADAAWRALREWVEHLTGAPCTASNTEVLIEIRRQKHLAGQLSTTEMLNGSDDAALSATEVEFLWMHERCPNTKACASRFGNRASWANVRSEVRMERHWHRQSARHMRFLPPPCRTDETDLVFLELPPATSYASVAEGQQALVAAQEKSGR